jgi:hypothetical protein
MTWPRKKMPEQTTPTFAQVLNQATLQDNWEEQFRTHNINEDIPLDALCLKDLS